MDSTRHDVEGGCPSGGRKLKKTSESKLSKKKQRGYIHDNGTH